MRDVITTVATDLGSEISIRNQSPQCIFVVVARRCSLYASVQHTSRSEQRIYTGAARSERSPGWFAPV